jgi:CheY-like chemotaxis protein
MPVPPSLHLEEVRGSGTLLLVDDEDMVREVAVTMLEYIGYTVIPASGGKEAVSIYQRQQDQIDLVILDMIMPDMTGAQTFDALKRLNPKVRVLLSSGFSAEGQAAEILRRGCGGFIQKPFQMAALSLKIKESLADF